MYSNRSLHRLTIRLVLLSAGIVAGCAAPSPQTRLDDARALAARSGWEAVEFPGRRFTLSGFVPAGTPTQTKIATVYFEGDGAAWQSPDTPSDDPTPIHPVALELALAQPGGTAAYVARPCQFRSQTAQPCDQRYWTNARYAPEVVEDMDHAVDMIERRMGASQVVLVGYSGGGALAALVAARRHDVALLVTVAANTDVAAWTRIERLRPLNGSLDPADFTASLIAVPQVHFVGTDDEVVPPSVARAFAAHFPASAPLRTIEIDGFDHACCWVQRWPTLIAPLLPR
ncbi:Alpha/beta hydrolase family protein [Caballeronia temeraria]|uniref:Alpha/beta hydrolase family protein n=1 Tax=Caballeronia temeraria TaxID=1777137 RepID=A0A158AR61_9BURK|nr:alpha/beta hydrolase [Caballeronia temeraria]SAK60199.1 Alpha/beta hydrolase family protein [Caballeronia temeraria]